MLNNGVTYSNRQVKGTEDLFGPDDADALLVGGSNQPSFQSGANLVINNAVDGVTVNTGANDNFVYDQDDSEFEEEAPPVATDLTEPDKLGAVTKVTFTQVANFTPNGTFLANVIAEIEEVKGATDYQITYFKVS